MEPQEIKDWRKSRGIRTQARFAQMLGISREAIARWETGASKPQPYIIRALRDLDREMASPKP